ncbi:hypothetical protein E2C01_053622 [Portunus trituberculatus]|uniref:Uncharacterized protein n=1 Tax=Portunus trituberculatus TaxID=210409 RepID=A0A5B7GRB2_PORTR|nr:hypothetical protein [Portunus trituberculatus]
MKQRAAIAEATVCPLEIEIRGSSSGQGLGLLHDYVIASDWAANKDKEPLPLPDEKASRRYVLSGEPQFLASSYRVWMAGFSNYSYVVHT